MSPLCSVLQQFNALSLDPQDPASLPPELLEALALASETNDDLSANANAFASGSGYGRDPSPSPSLDPSSRKGDIEREKHASDPRMAERLREEMQRDALQPLRSVEEELEEDDGVDDGEEREVRKKGVSSASPLSDEDVAEARAFLQLPVSANSLALLCFCFLVEHLLIVSFFSLALAWLNQSRRTLDRIACARILSLVCDMRYALPGCATNHLVCSNSNSPGWRQAIARARSPPLEIPLLSLLRDAIRRQRGP